MENSSAPALRLSSWASSPLPSTHPGSGGRSTAAPSTNSSDCPKYRITLTGEEELETFVVDAPFFSRRSRSEEASKIYRNYNGVLRSSGQAGGEMILVVDLCYRDGSLSRDEFVRPVEQLLREAGASYVVRHYAAVAAPDLEVADAVILCGTALKDTGVTEHPERFRWLPAFERRCSASLRACWFWRRPSAAASSRATASA
jgi:hypothetical protein